MKKLICLLILVMIFASGCSDKAAILFNRHPISEQNIYDYSVIFPVSARIYYVILMPKKVQSRYIYIQVIKKDNSYGQFGYKLIWTKNVRLKDEEINYYTDYLVLNESGYYIMKVYSKDNPQKVLTSAEFHVGN
jgi:hypothetical protein